MLPRREVVEMLEAKANQFVRSNNTSFLPSINEVLFLTFPYIKEESFTYCCFSCFVWGCGWIYCPNKVDDKCVRW